VQPPHGLDRLDPIGCFRDDLDLGIDLE